MKLIVDMELPKDCPMCPMAHYNKLDEFTGCEVAAGKLFTATRDKAYAESTSRPSWCPIKGELVTCGECKYWEFVAEVDGVRYGDCTKKDALISRHMMPWADYFCADGERKDDEQIH